MLKIKDNIDLNELEKFGFIKGMIYNRGKKVDVYTLPSGSFDIRCDTRNIIFYCHQFDLLFDLIQDCHQFDLLFDLIQAGLVEKVVEE